MVCLDLRPPVVETALGKPSADAVMAMPEATVDEEDNFPRGEDEIGRSWQVPPVKSITVSGFVKLTANSHLRAGILVLHLCHNRASAVRGDSVRHRTLPQ